MRVLVVEDEVDLASTLSRALDEAHFAVDVAPDGEEAQFMLAEVSYDAVVLDLMVPKRSGWALLQDLRQSGSRTPVLILTALDAVEDRVRALDLGADDYLPKPFAISELVARLRALVRRAARQPVAGSRRRRHHDRSRGAARVPRETRQWSSPRASTRSSS